MRTVFLMALFCSAAMVMAVENVADTDADVEHPVLPGLGSPCLPARRRHSRNWRVVKKPTVFRGVCTAETSCPAAQSVHGYCAGIGVMCCTTAVAAAAAPAAAVVTAAANNDAAVAPPADYSAPGDDLAAITPAPAAIVPAAAATVPAAAGTVPILKAAVPGAGCTAIKGRCIARTACTGANFVQTGLCPGATYCCVPSTPLPANFGATLAASANAVCSSYRASGAVYSQPKRQFGMSVKYSDCSSFVQSVFEHAGQASFFGRANAQTQAMRNVITRRGGGYHKTGVQLGDIVMWASGSTGHVGIVTKICTPTTFQFTGMGSKGCGPYPLNGSCMTWQQMTAYGLGGANGFQGYWTAR